MDVITCSSDPFSKLNVMRRDLHLGKFLWTQANRGYYDKSKAARNLNRARHNLRCYLYGQGKTYVPHIDTTIKGIPCGIVVESYTPGKPWRQHTFPGAGPGDCDPPEPAECEWFVVDSNGYRADWLLDKLTPNDVREIEQEMGL